MRRCFARLVLRRSSSASGAALSVGTDFLQPQPIFATTMFFSSSSMVRCSAPTAGNVVNPEHPPATAAAEEAPKASTTGNAGTDAAASALDLAMRVNKLKRQHQTAANGSSTKKQLEYTAWKELNLLTEEQINHAEGKAVALLLNSWAYFAKFWERGKDGPHGTQNSADGGSGGTTTDATSSTSSSS